MEVEVGVPHAVGGGRAHFQEESGPSSKKNEEAVNAWDEHAVSPHSLIYAIVSILLLLLVFPRFSA